MLVVARKPVSNDWTVGKAAPACRVAETRGVSVMSTHLGDREGAVIALYRRYLKLISNTAPSSVEREAADHALSLVLSGARNSANQRYLVRSVIRDSRRIVRRISARRRRDVDVYDQADALPSSAPDPEQVMIGRERFGQVIELKARLDPESQLCLEGMLDGESVRETVDTHGINRRRVLYIRACLRKELKKMLIDKG
jgi:hypothetical protein